MTSAENVRPERKNNTIEQVRESALEIMLKRLDAQLVLDPSTDDLFIKNRISELSTKNISQSSEISHIWNPIHEGFIPSEVGVLRSVMVDPVHIDDPQIYSNFLNVLREYRSLEALRDKPVRYYLLVAIQYSLARYFGNVEGDAHTEQQNRIVYTNHSTNENIKGISISEFKDKGIAVCAEKAPTAQNLLAFSGYNTKLIASTKCRIPSEKDAGAHYFNLMSSDKGTFIYDPTNASMVTDEQGQLISMQLSLHKIEDSEIETFLNGGIIAVTHTNFLKVGEGFEKNEKQWIYGGPTLGA